MHMSISLRNGVRGSKNLLFLKYKSLKQEKNFYINPETPSSNSVGQQDTKVILFSNDASFVPLSSTYDTSQVYTNASSICLRRTYKILIAFFSKATFFTDKFKLLYLDEFCTQKARKGLKILRGTSSFTFAIKWCFHFSNFRYGFPVCVTNTLCLFFLR